MNKQEMISRVKVLAGQSNLDEDEQAELTKLNGELFAVKAKEDAAGILAQAERDEAARIEREKNEAVAEAVKAEQAKSRRLPYMDGVAPYQTQFHEVNKYGALDHVELGMVIEALSASNKPVSPNAYKALSLRIGELKDTDDQSRKDNAYIRRNFEQATGIAAKMEAIEAAVKSATDPMYTGGTTDGAYWVGAGYSTDLWRVIRANCLVASRVPEQIIPDNYPNLSIPLESTDPTWYKVAEATTSESTVLKYPGPTITASQAVTPAQKTITVSKLGARVLYTGEMVEDALIQFVPTLRSQLEISGTEIMEAAMIDGDTQTTSNTNINAIDTTPTATDWYLVCNGFRKLALVTNTNNSRSAGGTLSITDYIDTLKLMGTAGLAASDPSKVAFIVDGNVHYANMKLPEVATRDVHSAATIENGFLKMAYNVPIIPSWQMHHTSAKRMANSAGKIDADTDGNNTLGAIVAVRFDQWKQAFKRRMTMETTRIANADSWEIVALARWGLAYRDSEASAITYNVGV